MDFDELTITGNYSDYDILEWENKLLTKTTMFGSKPNNTYTEGEHC